MKHHAILRFPVVNKSTGDLRESHPENAAFSYAFRTLSHVHDEYWN